MNSWLVNDGILPVMAYEIDPKQPGVWTLLNFHCVQLHMTTLLRCLSGTSWFAWYKLKFFLPFPIRLEVTSSSKNFLGVLPYGNPK